jgi:GT2 family glycosyltransferase
VSRVACIIVTWNSAAIVPPLLQSIPCATSSATATHTIIVDNASTDGTVATAREVMPDATIVARDVNDGYAAAINAGMEHAGDADYVLVLNPDVRLEAGFVRAMLDAAEQPGVGIVAPRLLDANGHTLPTLRRDPTVTRALGEAVLGGRRAGRMSALGEMVVDPAAYEQPQDVDWASGAALLITRPCAEAVGEWDESFFLYSEETDFALRARDAGFRVRYTPQARAVHLEGASHVSDRLWTILTVNRVRLYARRHGRASTLAFRGAVIVNEGLRALAGSSRHRSALRALLDAQQAPSEGARRGDAADGQESRSA